MSPGDRVGVYHYRPDDGTPFLIGYGVYDGDRLPEIDDDKLGDGGWTDLFIDLGGNPHLTLDDGREMWGFECFWTDEDAVRTLFSHPPPDDTAATEGDAMKRTASNKAVTVAARFTAEEATCLSHAARRHRMSLSALLRFALYDYMRPVPPIEPVALPDAGPASLTHAVVYGSPAPMSVNLAATYARFRPAAPRGGSAS